MFLVNIVPLPNTIHQHCHSSWKTNFSTFFSICMHKEVNMCFMYKGQPRIIIWPNLVDRESLMLYTKSQGFIFLGFGEKTGFYHTCAGWQLGQQAKTIWINSISLYIWMVQVKFCWNLSSAFRGNSLETVNSCDLEMKVKGHPLTFLLIYFYALG